MIRDITIGQYYPAKSPSINWTACKDYQYAVVSDITIFIPEHSGLFDRYGVSLWLYQIVQSSCEVYPERIETDFHSSADYDSFQSVFDNRRKNLASRLGFPGDRRGISDSCVHGDPPDLPHHGGFPDDLYNDADSADGCH